jgi:hypothetical protein
MASTAVKATASVETAATMESTTAMEAAGIAVAVGPVSSIAVAIISAAAIVAVTIVSAAAIEAVTIVAAVIPGAGADEDATGEVIRPIVAVRSAGVRIVAVVPVSADRRGADGAVYGAYSYSNSNPYLRLGIACSKKQYSQQCNIFQVTHIVPLLPAWPRGVNRSGRGASRKLPWGSALQFVKHRG